MEKRVLTGEIFRRVEEELARREKSPATAGKYLRCLRGLAGWLGGRELTHERAADWKRELAASQRPATVNGKLAALAFLCRTAGVEPGKVFPHNLRHLFARALLPGDPGRGQAGRPAGAREPDDDPGLPHLDRGGAPPGAGKATAGDMTEESFCPKRRAGKRLTYGEKVYRYQMLTHEYKNCKKYALQFCSTCAFSGKSVAKCRPVC